MFEQKEKEHCKIICGVSFHDFQLQQLFVVPIVTFVVALLICLMSLSLISFSFEEMQDGKLNDNFQNLITSIVW